MEAPSSRSFPLYNWWFNPSTAGMNDPRQIIKALLDERGLYSTGAKYHSPYLMSGMQAAVERIAKAIMDKEKILIHGDYDVDGIVGVILLFRFLKALDARPVIFLPTRQNHGYGLSIDAVDKSAIEGISLIITVDCGVSDSKNIECGKAKGIDFVITDHHELPEHLPDSVAIVHPSTPGSTYPYTTLSGTAVVYKLLQALAGHLGKSINSNKHLPYVALSTITDVMPMTGENWHFVRDGIKALREGNAPHLELLARFAQIRLDQIGARELGYHVGSRLNAPGRLESPVLSAKFLMETDKPRMEKIAQKIDDINNRRRDIQEKVASQAVAKANTERDVPVHILYNPDWHLGLLGTAASRVVEEFNHPAILFTKDDNGFIKGSGRSPEGINLFELITGFSGLLEQFGGHAGACGLTIDKSNFDNFRAQVIEHTSKSFPDGFPPLQLDITSSSLPINDIDMNFAEELKTLEPYGRGNPQPLFEFGPLAIENANFVGNGSHLKMDLKSKSKKFSGILFKAKGIRLGEVIGKTVTIAATPYINDYNGKRSVELQVHDMQIMD